MSVDHYENFPVASWLCPPTIRPAIRAIYRFARTADDLADEGDALPEARLQALSDYRGALNRAVHGQADPRWPAVFGPLGAAIDRHALPLRALEDLLSAFEQDVCNPAYADRAALLDYCARSANPVGRLLLHLYGISDALSLRQSDLICTALQLVNFWQDLGIDARRGRHYVPSADLRRHRLTPAELAAGVDSPASRALAADLVGWARELMLAGAPLARRVPGRAGWELRLVVQGGLLILDKITRSGYAVLSRRPTVGPLDAPRLVRGALRKTAG